MVELEELKKRLRKCGMKVTPQRLTAWKILEASKEHPDAERVYMEIKKTMPGISLATVYSALRAFEKAGLAHEIGLFGTIRRFDANTKPHRHLVCISCKKLKDLDEFNEELKILQDNLARETRFKLITTTLMFHGYCPDCKKKGGAIWARQKLEGKGSMPALPAE